MTLAIVLAVAQDGFVPVTVHRDNITDECYTKPLVVDDRDDPHSFASFAEAQRVIRFYVDGPACGNVRKATWERHFTKWGWEIDEVFPTAHFDEGREDFHADG